MKLSSQCKKPLSLFLAVALLLTGIFPGLSTGSGTASAEPIIAADRVAATAATQAPPVTASPASGTKIATGSKITLNTSVTASVYYSVYANKSTTAEVAEQLYTAPITVHSDITSLKITAYASLSDSEKGPTSTF
ncbi:hypothetical protein ACFTAO_51340 [Paenibacillus rhizoplanae]